MLIASVIPLWLVGYWVQFAIHMDILLETPTRSLKVISNRVIEHPTPSLDNINGFLVTWNCESAFQAILLIDLIYT